MSKALGLIEVNGYLAAVEAADSALKAAGVTLIGLEKVNAAITVVKLTGDVAAVKAAVDAGTAAAEALGRLRTSHVIPRLDEQLTRIIASKKVETKSEVKINETADQNEAIEIKDEAIVKDNPVEIKEEEFEVKDKDIENSMEAELEKKAKEEAVEEFIDELIEAKNKAISKEKALEPIPTINETEQKPKAKAMALEIEEGKADLNSMKVEALRRLARNLKLPMTNKQIKFAKKDELIRAIEENNKVGDK